MSQAREGTVTKAELEEKLRSLQTGLTTRVEQRKPSIVKIAAGAGLLVLIIAFLMGQRRGKRRSAIVEIRRF